MRGILRFKSTRGRFDIFQISKETIQGSSIECVVCNMYKATLQDSSIYNYRLPQANKRNGKSSFRYGSRNR
jgi:hypothetical protein